MQLFLRYFIYVIYNSYLGVCDSISWQYIRKYRQTYVQMWKPQYSAICSQLDRLSSSKMFNFQFTIKFLHMLGNSVEIFTKDNFTFRLILKAKKKASCNTTEYPNEKHEPLYSPETSKLNGFLSTKSCLIVYLDAFEFILPE